MAGVDETNGAKIRERVETSRFRLLQTIAGSGTHREVEKQSDMCHATLNILTHSQTFTKAATGVELAKHVGGKRGKLEMLDFSTRPIV